ncbi:aprataxin-like protein [Botryosphaeria dothidea]|uniref:Aprataxin-like protein n=1 Tax=Botryosphaeria dothidea TaxID=55169 RepID=A0A8H4IUA6_9PEZI|nr:aprataxin-like protein [Botryosphaeria dothidea]
MTASDDAHEQPVTGEDVKDEIVVDTSSSAGDKRRNAFIELMSRKQPKSSNKTAPESRKSTTVGTKVFPGMYGLGAYIDHPDQFGPERVVDHNEDFVIINDLFPKSVIHCLIIPRDQMKTLIHPFEAFEDPQFLALCKAEAERVKKVVGSELRRRYGQFSKQEQARIAAMESDDPPDEANLPPGRDWTTDLLVGIHAGPSMANLHIHVLSPDRHSPCLKHRKHYNSFSTPFLVPLDAFPLAENDIRRRPGEAGYLNEDFICWRCQRTFGKNVQRLKDHLAEEFEKWRSE